MRTGRGAMADWAGAEVSAGAGFTLTGEFADYPVKVDGLDSSG